MNPRESGNETKQSYHNHESSIDWKDHISMESQQTLKNLFFLMYTSQKGGWFVNDILTKY